MAGINKVIIIGHLGRDPEIRSTQGGTEVCRLNVATTRQWINKQTQEKMEETEWHRVTVWGKQAVHCNQYLAKGREVYVEGRLKTSSWEKDGIKRYSTDIIAETVQFLGGRPETGDHKHEAQRQEQPTPPVDSLPPPPEDDDIPF